MLTVLAISPMTAVEVCVAAETPGWISAAGPLSSPGKKAIFVSAIAMSILREGRT